MRKTHELIYYAPERPGHSFDVSLAGYSYCDGSYRIQRKQAPRYVFEYVISGQGFHRGKDELFRPQAGDIYIAHAKEDHEYWSSAEDPWDKIWINVGGSLVESLMREYGLQEVYHVEQLNLLPLFEKMVSTVRDEPSLASQKVAPILHEVISEIAAFLEQTQETGTAKAIEALKLKNYLEANTGANVTLEQMAGVCHKSPSQTIRLFKKEFHVTPYRYHLELKIKRAQQLLDHSSKTIKEIAFELGFSDEYHFSNGFKKKTGLAPRKYRMRGA